MYYADIGLAGGTYAYKKEFLKLIENRHAYYMPNHSGMCDGPYHETQADHWVYIRVESKDKLEAVVKELDEKHKFSPHVHYVEPNKEVYGPDNKTYETLEYETRDYVGQEFYPGLNSEEE